MLVSVLRGKLHRAVVTVADPDYEGSISIDADLLAAAGIYHYEKVLVANVTNGERLETYAIPAPAGSGEVGLNGAAAMLGRPGHVVIIMAFGLVPEAEAAAVRPRIVLLGPNNRIAPGPAAPL